MVARPRERYRNVALNSNAETCPVTIPPILVTGSQDRRDPLEPRIGWEQISVEHAPEFAMSVAQQIPEIGGAIDLTISRLTNLHAKLHKVVAIDRATTAGNRAAPAPECDRARRFPLPARALWQGPPSPED